MFSQNSKVDKNTLTQLKTLLGSLLADNELVQDSRKVKDKSIFCAYPGTNNDGRDYIAAAIKLGAKFVLWESGINFDFAVPNMPVENLMLYIGLLAAAKYDCPSKKFRTIGVTGTNGKTSITHWLSQVYNIIGMKAGIIGTTGAGVYPNVVYNDSTTPDPLTLQNIMKEFAELKVDVVTMEVSSHALHQGRVNGVYFNTAVFTNLTQDHLDYHGDMENYYQAKHDLFYWQNLQNAVINVDDEYGRRLFDDVVKARTDLKVIDYGINSGTLSAKNISINLSGMQFSLNYLGQLADCQVKVIGKFNVYNLLAVTGVLLLDGHKLTDIVKMLSQLTPVCGRMDAIILPDKPLVIVDFSHTPDSLKNALITLKEVEHTGKLYCVFGCGGNRDNSKRPIMGDIATQIADYTIVTSDNSRFEEAEAIIEQIKCGIKNTNYTTITDRVAAIQHALSIARFGDIVLIAGKGHETYQEIKGIKHQFSDFTIARDFLHRV